MKNQLAQFVTVSALILVGSFSCLHAQIAFPAPSLKGYMGAALASDGDIFISSASHDYRGAVYCYRKTGTTWKKFQTISSPLEKGNSNFGNAADLDNNTMIVGDTEFDGEDKELGSAYILVLKNGKFVVESRLQHPLKTKDTNFGEAVAIADNYAAVGANYGTRGQNAGEIHIYNKQGSTWKSIQSIEIKRDFLKFTWFGSRIQMDGNWMAVTAIYDKVHGKEKAGSVYVYHRDKNNRYVFVDKLYIDIKESKSGQEFGSYISLKDGFLAIHSRLSHGTVYLYQLNESRAKATVEFSQKIKQPNRLKLEDPVHYSYGFGAMLAINKDYLVIGAEQLENRRFSALVYRNNGHDRFTFTGQYVRFPFKRSYDGYFPAELTLNGSDFFISDPEDDLTHIDSTYIDKPKGIVYGFTIENYLAKKDVIARTKGEPTPPQPIANFPFGDHPLLKEADAFLLDRNNGDGVFILRNKKTQKWGMYQALESEWSTLIPQRYDSIDFFEFNGRYTRVYNDGLMALYPSKWSFDIPVKYLPCKYDKLETYGRKVAMRRGDTWVWIDVRTGKEIPGISAKSFLDLPLPPEDSK